MKQILLPHACCACQTWIHNFFDWDLFHRSSSRDYDPYKCEHLRGISSTSCIKSRTRHLWENWFTINTFKRATIGDTAIHVTKVHRRPCNKESFVQFSKYECRASPYNVFQMTMDNVCVSTDILQSQHVSRNVRLHDMRSCIVCRPLETRVGQHSIVCLYGKD